MPELIGRCPVCEAELTVTRLHCDQCGTGLDGEFQLTRFDRLTRDQLSFAEVFLKCRGVIRDVERELGISYPTVRGRLDDLIRALELECTLEESSPLAGSAAEAPVLSSERRRQIHEDVGDGHISASTAARLLRGERADEGA